MENLETISSILPFPLILLLYKARENPNQTPNQERNVALNKGGGIDVSEQQILWQSFCGCAYYRGL